MSDMELDWKAAKEHFDAVRRQYEALRGRPGVNTALALMLVFAPLAARYDSGERSRELWAAMMAVE